MLRAVEIYRDTATTLIAVESVVSSKIKSQSGCQFFGYIEPVAIVVLGPADAYALDMDGQSVDLNTFARDVPELERLIASRTSFAK